MNSVFLVTHPDTIKDLEASHFASLLPRRVPADKVGNRRYSAEEPSGRVYFQLDEADNAFHTAELEEIATGSRLGEPYDVLEIEYTGHLIYDVLQLLAVELPGAAVDLQNGRVGPACEVALGWTPDHPIHRGASGET